MRIVMGGLLLALAAVASDATAGDAAADCLADDLLCRFGAWDGCDGWYSANRSALLRPSWRAIANAPGTARPVDAAARDRARAALDGALTAKDGFVASEAALALGLAGDARDIAVLARIVSDRSASPRMQRWAAVGLGSLPLGDAAQSAAARDALLGVLASRRDAQAQSFWATCAYALAMRGDAAAVPRLIELRRSILAASMNPRGVAVPDEVTGALTYALGALGGSEVLPEVEKYLRAKQNPEAADTMWSVVHALGRIHGDGSVALLRELTTDVRQPVRCVALQALGSAAGAKATPRRTSCEPRSNRSGR